MTDVISLDEEQVIDLHKRGVIKFTNRYELMMKNRLMEREGRV